MQKAIMASLLRLYRMLRQRKMGHLDWTLNLESLPARQRSTPAVDDAQAIHQTDSRRFHFQPRRSQDLYSPRAPSPWRVLFPAALPAPINSSRQMNFAHHHR